MKRVLPFTLIMLLSACATPQEIEARRIEQEQQDTETCKSYGLRPGSEAFGMCRLQLDLAREQHYRDDHAYYYGGYYPRSHGANIGYYITH